MQNHVLPYLQSFCSLEEKGVQERREQQIADKKESRATAVTGVEKEEIHDMQKGICLVQADTFEGYVDLRR